MSIRSILIYVSVLSLFGSCKKGTATEADADPINSYVVMVSFDGFRWDYTDMNETPNFDQLATKGVKADRLIPSFPTSTFPNHYTLATGLYPDHHGIINNSFYAPELGGIYRIGDTQMVTNGSAYFGEPIWVTAEKQGVKSACYFWVGSEAEIMGVRPTYWNRYDGRIPYTYRVDQVIDWLSLPMSQRPALVTLYFDEPDHTAHGAGPESEATGEEVEYLDSILGYLRVELSKLEHKDRINLIVLSDHGMGSISADKYVNLNDYLKEDWTVSVVGGNPMYLIQAQEDCADSITNAFEGIEGLSAWQKEDIPDRLHYGSSPRFPGIMVLADSTWSIGTQSDPSGYSGGAHGYDNAYSSMHTIFYAEGPAFKENYSAASFSNVEIYGIIAHLLGLDPEDTDGDIKHVSGLFKVE
jgi:predicted AlkP superfamily pyrophosphatase or phosphodiesterase